LHAYIITVGTPLFGLNPGPDPIVLENVTCTGMESDISSCQTSQLGSISSMCQEPNRAAGIRCSLVAGSCVDGQARLVDGPAFNEGRFEVCLNNQWLSVCDAGFSSETANEVCNSRLLLTGGGYNTVPVEFPVVDTNRVAYEICRCPYFKIYNSFCFNFLLTLGTCTEISLLET
jgi:hypothetical protein